MDSGFFLGVILFLSMFEAVQCDQIPNGVLHMECRDRFLMIAVDLSFTGNEPHFEAVGNCFDLLPDETSVHPITTQMAAECGYFIRVLPVLGHVELRASYFSCHTNNKDDKVFTFNFNLVTHKGKAASHVLNKTCSPLLPWSPREVTCELNYMEVSVRSDVACPTGTKRDDWDATVQTAYSEAISDWQVMFQGEHAMPMNLSEAHDKGYAFDLTDGRLVFRTPYGQPDSFSTEVNGVPVEVVHATLFSRQSWVVLMVDLVAACSMHEGSYDGGYMMWVTPEVLHPMVSGQNEMQLNMGVNGELVEQPIAEERGYLMEKHNNTVQISIPYNAEGGYRKSFVSDGLFEYHIFDLYMEKLSMDDDGDVDTRLRFHKTLATPLLPRPVYTENRTVLEESMFTVCLRDVPEDLDLVAVRLNGHEFIVPFPNMTSITLSKVDHPNNTHDYVLKVPFDNPVVIQQFSKADAMMQINLDINFTMTVLPENEPFSHLVSVMALMDVSPPAFDAICTESGISFRKDHRPSDYLWVITIDEDPLTSELAAQHGYIMRNNSQSLQLEVPLFTHGYKYKDVTLKGFSGTFELLVSDHETSEVQSSTMKTCQFLSSEFIMCSTDGRMTVVADLSMAVSNGGVPARTNLVDKYCGPKETDNTRALFSFPLNSCGSTVKLRKEYVTYENEIFFSKKLHSVKNPADSSNEIDRVKIQCTYPLAGLFRLFSKYRFESDSDGVGQIVHSTHSAEDLMKPAATVQTPVSTTRRTRRPVSQQLGYYPPVQHISVSSFLKNIFKKGVSQAKVNAAAI